MQADANLFSCFSKINKTKCVFFLSDASRLPLIPKVGPSPNAKFYFCNYQYEMMNYYKHQELRHF